MTRTLDCQFEDNGRCLIVRGDLARGWSSKQRSGHARKTFCFSEVVDAEWQGGAIHCQLSVFPRPGGLSDEWATPPDITRKVSRGIAKVVTIDRNTRETSDHGLVDDYCVVRLRDGNVVAQVGLLTDKRVPPLRFDVRSNRGGDLMFERVYPDYGVRGRPFRIDIQLRLTFKRPAKPSPVELSFWNDFLPGGRPESNRRKF